MIIVACLMRFSWQVHSATLLPSFAFTRSSRCGWQHAYWWCRIILCPSLGSLSLVHWLFTCSTAPRLCVGVHRVTMTTLQVRNYLIHCTRSGQSSVGRWVLKLYRTASQCIVALIMSRHCYAKVLQKEDGDSSTFHTKWNRRTDEFPGAATVFVVVRIRLVFVVQQEYWAVVESYLPLLLLCAFIIVIDGHLVLGGTFGSIQLRTVLLLQVPRRLATVTRECPIPLHNNKNYHFTHTPNMKIRNNDLHFIGSDFNSKC